MLGLELKVKLISHGHIYPQRREEFGRRGVCLAPNHPFLCRRVGSPSHNHKTAIKLGKIYSMLNNIFINTTINRI